MKKISIIAVLLCLALGALPFKALALSTASFSVSGATYNPGATFTVPIYESSGNAPVTVVEADVSYDPTQLKVTDTDFDDSDFSGGLKNSDTGSTLSIIRYAFNGVTGQAKIGMISFMDIGPATSTAITFASSSQIYSNGKPIWDGVNTGATFNFTAPVSASSPPANPTPQPVTVSARPIKKATPITEPVSVASPTTNINSVNSASVYHTISPPIRASNEPWEALIVAAVLIIMALLVRLFNLHQRIKTRVQNRRRRLKSKRKRRKSARRKR